MSNTSSAAWKSDALLGPVGARAPHFVRMHWDKPDAHAFGPWRLMDKPDPTAGQQPPYTDYAKAEPTPEPDSASANTSAPAESAAVQQAHSPDLTSGTGAAQASPAAAGTAAADPGAVVQSVAVRDEHELRVARQQGYVQGLKDGMIKALSDMESDREKERASVRELMAQLQSLSAQPHDFFEPVRRLSMHIAEQLVRGELTVSSQALERLVRACLEELGHSEAVAVVSVHPDDARRLQTLQLESLPKIRIEPDPQLLIGSVRVRANDTEIEDLIEHRLTGLAHRILKDPQAWLSASALLKNQPVDILPDAPAERPWGNRPVHVEDATPKAETLRTDIASSGETAPSPQAALPSEDSMAADGADAATAAEPPPPAPPTQEGDPA